MGAIRERGRVCEIISCLFFFSFLPSSTCFHMPPICYKEKCKSIHRQPVHSACKEVNQTVATSWAVKETLKKTCNLCSDFYKPLICQTTEMFTTLSTSMNWKTFLCCSNLWSHREQCCIIERPRCVHNDMFDGRCILHQFPKPEEIFLYKLNCSLLCLQVGGEGIYDEKYRTLISP